MKTKILFLSILLFFFFVSSCKKENSANAPVTSVLKETNQRTIFTTTKDTVSKKNVNNNTIRLNSYSGAVSLSVNYNGSGSYNFQISIDVPSSANCQYRLIKDGILYETMGNDDNVFNYTSDALPAGNYYVEVAVTNSSSYSGTYTSSTYQVYAEPSSPAGTIHLLRYFCPATGHHFYTASWEEMASGSDGFHLEGITGFVYPTFNSDPNSIAIYRYYNNSTGDHLYSHTYSTPAGYTYEGITGFATSVVSGNFDTALNRYYSQSTADHLYSCPPGTVPNSYSLEGTVGYIQHN